MAEVFLCQTGQLTAASKRQLKQAGVVVVEVADPSACQFIRSSSPVSGDDMLWAALDAMKRSYPEDRSYHIARQVRSRFALNLAELMNAARPGNSQQVSSGA